MAYDVQIVLRISLLASTGTCALTARIDFCVCRKFIYQDAKEPILSDKLSYTNKCRYSWRRRRDSNPRTAFDRYAISSRAPSTKLGDSSIYIFFCTNPERSNPKPESVNAN